MKYLRPVINQFFPSANAESFTLALLYIFTYSKARTKVPASRVNSITLALPLREVAERSEDGEGPLSHLR